MSPRDGFPGREVWLLEQVRQPITIGDTNKRMSHVERSSSIRGIVVHDRTSTAQEDLTPWNSLPATS